VPGIFEHLNRTDPPLDSGGQPEAPTGSTRRRVLARLGAYTSLIVGPLNLRPTAASLLYQDDQRIEVRISTRTSHVVLVIVPDGDLAAEVVFLRALSSANLPIPRLIAYDLACTSVPFTYALESYAGGTPLDCLDDGPRALVAARQVGRTLRRVHSVTAPGFGRPTTTGRWLARTWIDALRGWLERYEIPARAEAALGGDGLAALWAATLDHPTLAWERPCLIHGAVSPARAIVTVGDGVQLEALARPGELVGGDPLFDLACGLLPRHSASFRRGLLEGYTAAGALAREQEQRLRRLRLLLLVADTVWDGDDQALARLPADISNALAALAG
jgi:aminoglycoside phosphotransferase (APT) family kinase protein